MLCDEEDINFVRKSEKSPAALHLPYHNLVDGSDEWNIPVYFQGEIEICKRMRLRNKKISGRKSRPGTVRAALDTNVTGNQRGSEINITFLFCRKGAKEKITREALEETTNFAAGKGYE